MRYVIVGEADVSRYPFFQCPQACSGDHPDLKYFIQLRTQKCHGFLYFIYQLRPLFFTKLRYKLSVPLQLGEQSQKVNRLDYALAHNGKT
jgi:hypothetical protein